LKRLLTLVAIEVFVWATMLLSMLLISRVAFGIVIGSGTLAARITTQVLRVLVSGTIVLIWLFVWKRITDLYFWRTIRSRRTT
jgi:hypothetical protein